MAARADPSALAVPAPPRAPDAGGALRVGVVCALVLAGGTALLLLLGLGEPTKPGPFFGTRLRMSERAVREHFEDGAEGRWASSEARDGTARLTWTPTPARPALPSSVIFEFDRDDLVAIRADLPPGDPMARGPAVQSTLDAVVGRRAEDGNVHLTVLARGCSKHFAEAAALFASAPKGEGAAR